jgi:hypothetical protein
MEIKGNPTSSTSQLLPTGIPSGGPKKSNKKLWFILSGALILIALAGGALFVFLKKPASNTSNTTTQSSNATSNTSNNDTTVTGPDADSDGLPDADEAKYGTDPKNPDTDGDGFNDGDEVKKNFDPLGPGNVVTASAVNSCENGNFVFNPANNESYGAAFGQVNVEIILDGSGSMAEKIGGETKMDAAKRVINQIIDGLPNKPNLNVGFRAYGYQSAGSEHNCQDTKLLVPIKGVDKQALKNATNSISAKGYTPIAYSLGQAAKDFPTGEKNYNTVILISDGIESCGGNPSDVAKQIYEQTGLRINTHVVGLGVGSNDAKTLETIADNAGGTYNTAKDVDALNSALSSVIKKIISGGTLHVSFKNSDGKPFQATQTLSYRPQGEEVIRNRAVPLDSNGEAIVPLDPGTYTFQVSQITFQGQDVKPKDFNAVIKEGFETRADIGLGKMTVTLPKASSEDKQPVLFNNNLQLVDLCSAKQDDVVVLFAKNWPTVINPTTSTSLEVQTYPGLYRLQMPAPRVQKVVAIQGGEETNVDFSSFFGIVHFNKHPWNVKFPNATQMSDSSFVFPCCKVSGVETDRGEYGDVYKKTFSVYAFPGTYQLDATFHDDVTKKFTPSVTVNRGGTTDLSL